MPSDDPGFGPPWLARINAWFLIVCIAAGFVALVVTGFRTDWPEVDRSAVAGGWTLPYERGMDGDMVTRDTAVTLWAAIDWSLFREGHHGVVVGRDGWLFSLEEFEGGPDADPVVAEKLAQIEAVRDRLAEAGVDRLVVALVPDKSRIYADMLADIGRRPTHAARYQAFRAALVAAGIAAPDLLVPLDEARAATQTHMRTDTHWSPAGAAVVAEALAEAIADLPEPPPSLHGRRFVTTTIATEAHAGDLTKFIPLGPLRPLLLGAPEPLEQRSTREAPAGDLADASGSDDLGSLLFDEVTIPAVLIGTSYSAMDEWNFDGALKQALGMDVLNLADEGGGPMAPMAAYLQSETLRDSPPEIVIWEIPERYLPVAYELPAGGPAPEQQPSAPEQPSD
jgi:alginate O-acetyltransferase complex protein AlgJ